MGYRVGLQCFSTTEEAHDYVLSQVLPTVTADGKVIRPYKNGKDWYLNEQKINLADTATFKSWAAAQKSFDSKKLIAAYDAPASLAAAKKMQSLTETYRIDGTPDVIVGGKYRVIFSSDWANGQKIIGELINKVRQERSGKAAR